MVLGFIRLIVAIPRSWCVYVGFVVMLNGCVCVLCFG